MIRESFIACLQSRLTKPLPGILAQARLAPPTHPGRLTSVPPGARAGSVLILLFPAQDGILQTVFIRRPNYNGVHSGQISFPGGKPETSDGSLYETALREAFEEVGILPCNVNYLGQLSPLYIPPSRFLVTPFVGYSATQPLWIADPLEVDEIITLRINDLISEDCLNQLTICVPGTGSIQVPCFTLQNVQIWGATAMILSEFLEIFQECLHSGL